MLTGDGVLVSTIAMAWAWHEGHGMVMDGASVTALQCSGPLSLKHCAVSRALARREGQEPARAHAPQWPHVCQLCITTGDLAFTIILPSIHVEPIDECYELS